MNSERTFTSGMYRPPEGPSRTVDDAVARFRRNFEAKNRNRRTRSRAEEAKSRAREEAEKKFLDEQADAEEFYAIRVQEECDELAKVRHDNLDEGAEYYEDLPF